MADVWYLAFCVDCNGGIHRLLAGDESVSPMPFSDLDERTKWVNAHMEGTGHAILLMDQHKKHDTTTTTTTTTKDDTDATT